MKVGLDEILTVEIRLAEIGHNVRIGFTPRIPFLHTIAQKHIKLFLLCHTIPTLFLSAQRKAQR